MQMQMLCSADLCTPQLIVILLVLCRKITKSLTYQNSTLDKSKLIGIDMMYSRQLFPRDNWEL